MVLLLALMISMASHLGLDPNSNEGDLTRQNNQGNEIAPGQETDLNGLIIENDVLL